MYKIITWLALYKLPLITGSLKRVIINIKVTADTFSCVFKAFHSWKKEQQNILLFFNCTASQDFCLVIFFNRDNCTLSWDILNANQQICLRFHLRQKWSEWHSPKNSKNEAKQINFKRDSWQKMFEKKEITRINKYFHWTE